MTKRQAQALAKRLGVEFEPTMTAAQLLEQIQAEVDEAAEVLEGAPSGDDPEDLIAVAEALLEAAAAEGIEPTAAEVEGEVVAPGEEPAGEIEGAAEEEASTELGDVVDEIGKALALREQAVAPTHALPSVAEFNVLGLLANKTFDTTFVPVAYRGREADVFAAFLFGREIGLGPMMSLRDIYMIDGRPALAAHRQLAKLRQGGVVILESEATSERAYIKARRTDTGEVMAIEFTMGEAARVIDKKGAHLIDKTNWKSWPADMLWARVVGRLTRRLGPDIAGGLPPYVAEEVADFSDWNAAFNEEGPSFTAPAPSGAAAQPSMPEYRKEFPDYNWPSSMVEIRDRLGMIVGEAEAPIWLGQAREAMFPGVELGAHSREQIAHLFQALSTVLATLDGPDGPTQFENGIRPKIQAVFAKRLGGSVLEGPPWSLSPDEAETRPQRGVPEEEPAAAAGQGAEEVEAIADGAPAAVTEPVEGSESYYAQFDDVGEIPFGSDAASG